MTDIVSKPDYGSPIGNAEGKSVSLSEQHQVFFDDLEEKLNTNLLGLQVQLTSYVVASLPAATTAGGLIFVSDEAGGAVPAFSDGTNWLRVTDRVTVSAPPPP